MGIPRGFLKKPVGIKFFETVCPETELNQENKTKLNAATSNLLLPLDIIGCKIKEYLPFEC